MIHADPVEGAEMPRVDAPEMSILTESEIASLLATYRRLEQDADEDAAWWRLARHVVEFALGTACAEAKSSASDGETWSSSTVACTCGKRS
jgi:hypothetical protein